VVRGPAHDGDQRHGQQADLDAAANGHTHAVRPVGGDAAASDVEEGVALANCRFEAASGGAQTGAALGCAARLRRGRLGRARSCPCSWHNHARASHELGSRTHASQARLARRATAAACDHVPCAPHLRSILFFMATKTAVMCSQALPAIGSTMKLIRVCRGEGRAAAGYEVGRVWGGRVWSHVSLLQGHSDSKRLPSRRS
jgi:hypothetical protein